MKNENKIGASFMNSWLSTSYTKATKAKATNMNFVEDKHDVLIIPYLGKWYI